MLRLYLIFMWDAVKATALGVVAALVLLAALSRFGAPLGLMASMCVPLAFWAYFLLAYRYLGRNLGWVLGLPLRKLTLAWFNFGLNLSLMALVGLGCSLVATIGYRLDADAQSRKMVEGLAGIVPPALPHGRALAMFAFAVTAVLFMCWLPLRWPDTQEQVRARQALGKRMLIIIPLIVAAQVLVFSSVTSRSSAVSPVLIFVAGVVLTCVTAPLGAAKMLGTSRRQRRTWALTGGAVALAEIILIVALTESDLASADPSVRIEAAKLLGSLGGERGRQAIEEANATEAANRYVPRADQRSAVPPVVPLGTRVELERTGGFGTGWLYTVALNDMGDVELQTPSATFAGKASRREFAKLVETIRERGLLDLESEYNCHVSDSGWVRLSVMLEGRTKSIKHDLGCESVRELHGNAPGLPPDWLAPLERRIDVLAPIRAEGPAAP